MNFRLVASALLFAGLTTLTTLAIPASAAADAGAAFVSVPGKAALLGEITLTAEVTNIDAASRTLTLKDSKGVEHQVVAGPEVRNFDQIKVGDMAVARAVQALSLELKKGGAGIRQRVDGGDVARTEAGDKPGVGAGRVTTILADVTKVDRKAGVVTAKGVKRTVKLKVDDPEQLKLIEVGDQIKATYVEAVAIGVVAKPHK